MSSPISIANLIRLLLIGGLLVWVSQAPSQDPPQAPPEEITRHSLSLLGPEKYPVGFSHFDYVNLHAPRDGDVRYAAVGGFDSLNPYIVKGRPAAGMNLIYDTLMKGSLDEPAASYPLVAQSVRYPEDISFVIFTLREEAAFHDGTPITAADVAWTFRTLKEHNPFFKAYYAHVSRVEILSSDEVRFVLASVGNREMPSILGQLPVLPRHYWQAREFNRTTLEPPLGSGPYRVASVSAGRSVVYERVDTYWGAALGLSRGQHNFKRVRVEYFGDDTVALQAFLAGDLDFRQEFVARNWATAYDIPAAREGRLLLKKVPSYQPQGMQAFVFNLRRPQFADRRVREAFNWAFDFEWTNRTFFYDQYVRSQSYFSNSPLAAQNLPEGEELRLLRRYPLRGEVFEKVFTNPQSTGGGAQQNLRRAHQLLKAAGWEVRDGRLTHLATDTPMVVEFLLVNPAFERVVIPYTRRLERLGIQATVRTVDSAQYRNRLDSYDFDMIVAQFPQSTSPGNEQRDFWGSASADRRGGRNLIGIKNPVVDDLIERLVTAPDYETLVVATRALDRVLLWEHYVVPQWHFPYQRLAYWADLGHPEPLPLYSVGFPAIWWQGPLR